MRRYVAVVFSSILAGLVWAYLNRPPAADEVFSSKAWKGADIDHDDPARLKMVDDLMRRYRLVGMKQADVDKMLGKPPKTGYFHDYDYVYWLGPERGFISIDSEWLCLKFRDKVVVEARLMRD